MSELKRIIPVILLHFLAGFIVSVIYVFVSPLSADLIPPFVFQYRMREAFILFVSLLPALQISGILVGYAFAFSKTAFTQVGRWSAILLSYLQGAFIICLCCIGLYVILNEGFVPFAKEAQTTARANTEDYYDYIEIARTSLVSGALYEAGFNAYAAQRIWPKSAEAAELAELSKYRMAESSQEQEPAPEEETRIVPSVPGLTVMDALDKAIEAEEDYDFFNAHYFAMLAWQLAKPSDPIRDTALRIAANAWNQITLGTDMLTSRQDEELFAEKKRGYDALQAGDYLKAYYLFNDLDEKYNRTGDLKFDPDIVRFLDIAKRGLQETFFS
ncbi:hypothetical protein K7I13_06410 [Brucepastera parasyntrophica]|uniref:hypothetical protein n=1 Tax=Brucepastera parasyntrophica TaxID=2880008 RepID=UPI0021098C62|nr:hypothetical protein [Brucepastera parasyntrophica]ULQ60891.1 hypothetical protein K7I13_06410 [Brucepastera parasyntrophica]